MASTAFWARCPCWAIFSVSKQGEGIFGLTYAMKGNLNEPSITVNPLSVLTTGHLPADFRFSPAKEPVAQPQASAEPTPAVPQ